jgi:protocatechuate 3,4-dioxygenase beta subunit
MPPKPHTTDDLVFLRGVQITDAQGTVEFKTIYPGHYPGRVNHIHMKVHVGGGATKPAEADSAHAGVEVYAGGHVAHTGQLFFSEDVSRFVEATHPYSSQKVRRTILDEDMVFSGQGGAGSVAKLTPVTSTQLSDGYVATLVVAVDPEATPKLVGIGGRPPRAK